MAAPSRLEDTKASFAELEKAGEAEAVYRDDLTRYPGVVRFIQALLRQGRGADANTAQREFERAWKNADVQLTSSAF